MATPRKPIVFIDTNIFLNFYRSRNDAGLHLLKRIEPLHADIVTTYQVEMEFKKNRQAAILEALSSLKMPESQISSPAFLSDSKSVEVIKRNLKETKSRISDLKVKIQNILANPNSHDPVSQITHKLFGNSGILNLKRTSPERTAIKRAAWKRFILGYPPRKDKDTSTGDAMNWEWMLHCVKNTSRDIIVVSGDLDYGCHIDNQSYINDWLSHELKERISRKRKVILTKRLSTALDRLHVKVTQEEKKDEESTLKSLPLGSLSSEAFKWPISQISAEDWERWNEAMKRAQHISIDWSKIGALSDLISPPKKDEG